MKNNENEEEKKVQSNTWQEMKIISIKPKPKKSFKIHSNRCAMKKFFNKNFTHWA